VYNKIAGIWVKYPNGYLTIATDEHLGVVKGTENTSGYVSIKSDGTMYTNGISGVFQKLEGIEDGAEVNVIETVQISGTSLPITSKTVNIITDNTPTVNSKNPITSGGVNNALLYKYQFGPWGPMITVVNNEQYPAGWFKLFKIIDAEASCNLNFVTKMQGDGRHAIGYIDWWFRGVNSNPYWSARNTGSLQASARITTLHQMSQNFTFGLILEEGSSANKTNITVVAYLPKNEFYYYITSAATSKFITNAGFPKNTQYDLTPELISNEPETTPPAGMFYIQQFIESQSASNISSSVLNPKYFANIYEQAPVNWVTTNIDTAKLTSGSFIAYKWGPIVNFTVDFVVHDLPENSGAEIFLDTIPSNFRSAGTKYFNLFNLDAVAAARFSHQAYFYTGTTGMIGIILSPTITNGNVRFIGSGSWNTL
jgi:hypothetical protein